MQHNNKTKTPKKHTPKKPRQSIRHDVVSAADYNKYEMPWACEDCTHYDSTTELCTLGYSTKWHRREYQQKTFELSGKMALCRFQEID